jgi:hypothetical protein
MKTALNVYHSAQPIGVDDDTNALMPLFTPGAVESETQADVPLLEIAPALQPQILAQFNGVLAGVSTIALADISLALALTQQSPFPKTYLRGGNEIPYDYSKDTVYLAAELVTRIEVWGEYGFNSMVVYTDGTAPSDITWAMRPAQLVIGTSVARSINITTPTLNYATLCNPVSPVAVDGVSMLVGAQISVSRPILAGWDSASVGGDDTTAGLSLTNLNFGVEISDPTDAFTIPITE